MLITTARLSTLSYFVTFIQICAFEIRPTQVHCLLNLTVILILKTGTYNTLTSFSP